MIRVLRSTGVTLSHTFKVDETATDAAGAVVVTVARLDGTVVTTGNATDAPGTGIYTYVLPGGPAAPASATWQVDELAVSWAATVGGAAITVVDTVEVVGGFLFDISDLRAEYTSLANTTTWPLALLTAKRTGVEQECERVCRQAFVPRFYRETLVGFGYPEVAVTHLMLRRVRACTIGSTVLTALECAALSVTDAGLIYRPGGAVWPAGFDITIEYEHGLDTPPAVISEAAMARCVARVGRPKSGVPTRAESFTVQDGGTYRLSTPDAQKVGQVDVDGDYAKWTRPRRRVAL